MTPLVGDALAPRYLAWLLQGFGVTLALSAATCLAGTALGFAACWAATAVSSALTAVLVLER